MAGSTLKDFRVIQAAVVIRTGKARSAVQRFVRGEILRLPVNHPRTKELLAVKAIAPKDSDVTSVTPAQVMKAAGAEADPVAANLPVTGEGAPVEGNDDADADAGQGQADGSEDDADKK